MRVRYGEIDGGEGPVEWVDELPSATQCCYGAVRMLVIVPGHAAACHHVALLKRPRASGGCRTVAETYMMMIQSNTYDVMSRADGTLMPLNVFIIAKYWGVATAQGERERERERESDIMCQSWCTRFQAA